MAKKKSEKKTEAPKKEAPVKHEPDYIWTEDPSKLESVLKSVNEVHLRGGKGSVTRYFGKKK